MTPLASSQGQNEGHKLLTYYTCFKACKKVYISANLTGEASIFAVDIFVRYLKLFVTLLGRIEGLMG